MKKTKIVALTFLSYFLGSLVTLIYMFFASIASFGDPCLTGSSSCRPETTIIGYLTPVVFGFVALTIVYWFLKVSPAKRPKTIYFEMIHIVILLFAGSLLGSYVVDLTSAPYENTKSTDALIRNASMFIAIVISASITSYLSWKNSLKKTNRK